MPDCLSAVDSILQGDSQEEYRRVLVKLSQNRRRFFELKYVIDVVFGSIMLFFFSPLILGLWLLVKLTSRGPGFYRQTRVGRNGQTFQVFKLRSMRVDAEKSGRAVWCSKSDNRMTWLGKILRALHLDELPQLFNVVRGDMSLIGPRPERPEICKELATKIDGYYDRVLVKPGITGLAQINLPPDTCLTDVKRKQVLDLRYINETDLWLEFRILLATAIRMFGIKGETTMNWMGLCRLEYLGKMRVADRPESQTWSSIRHDRESKPAPAGFPIVSQNEDEIDLDRDCDSIGSTSGMGSGIGLV